MDFDLEASFLRIGVGDRLILGSARLTLTDLDARGVAMGPSSLTRISGLTLPFVFPVIAR